MFTLARNGVMGRGLASETSHVGWRARPLEVFYYLTIKNHKMATRPRSPPTAC
jgi:hypothetical protein